MHVVGGWSRHGGGVESKRRRERRGEGAPLRRAGVQADRNHGADDPPLGGPVPTTAVNPLAESGRSDNYFRTCRVSLCSSIQGCRNVRPLRHDPPRSRSRHSVFPWSPIIASNGQLFPCVGTGCHHAAPWGQGVHGNGRSGIRHCRAIIEGGVGSRRGADVLLPGAPALGQPRSTPAAAVVGVSRASHRERWGPACARSVPRRSTRR